MASAQQLSPRAAILWGLVCMAVGCAPILIGLGVVPGELTPGTPGWVGVAAGLTFVCAGAAVIVGYAVAGGVGPDGDLPAGTPFAVRVTQNLLGFCIVGLMESITAWIAFGPGERHFSSTLTWAFGVKSAAASEREGRIVFGAGAVAIGIIWVVLTIVSVRRLLQASKAQGH
jgi:hypothetical protein